MKHVAFLFAIVLTACSTGTGKVMTEKYKVEILQTEADFARMAENHGVAAAFYFYADENAVINRGDSLIQGKEAIKSFYESHLKPGTVLQWTPEFVEVSGDLGYTFGKYTHMVPDSAGNIIKSSGIFHTVWRRQEDGTWRFVWD
jgi:ketosteroid isomerase-like protein